MLRWLTDENFNSDVVRGVCRIIPHADIVRARDAGLAGVSDEALLAWAAERGRILLTHDVSTITLHAYRRVVNGDKMPGVFEVGRTVSIRTAITDIVLLTECSDAEEWEGQVRYLPLR